MWIRHIRHRSACTVTLALILGLSATSCGASGEKQTAEYCAILSDAVGLYLGNPVTQMGYKLGKVKSIESRDTEVEVRFTLDEDRSLPADVRAVVRSPSILADRSLELVGNYVGGPKLPEEQCIPRNRTATPMSISQVIGSATDFVNAITPEESTNLQDALAGIDEAVSGNGEGANELLTRSSALLDNPDRTIAELGTITRNMAELTTMLRDNRQSLKSVVQAMPVTGADVTKAAAGAAKLAHPLPEVLQLVSDLELELGPEIQLALDTTSDTLRVLSPHYKGLANILNPLPRFISGLNNEPADAIAGGLAKRINNHVFALLPYRPPLFRIPTPNGLFACGVVNDAMPGSCADVGGRPYMVDVALLQYVLAEAARR
ncbi:MCE family protein [Mycolicibacterium porcinum]|uniref:MCE family protein n=1 Tax=Mycolicibacterium porcinum TaxID=39693 RepID=A0AAW5SVT6_9MYCO|nr:MCE family protein [Mycolicibacterium porcinum]MCV7386498.1 MCE family protein [Mycolicibacterium porcinum]